MCCCATQKPYGGLLAWRSEAHTVMVKVHLLKALAQVVRGRGGAPVSRLPMMRDIAGLPKGG